jgi:hypothetical protein
MVGDMSRAGLRSHVRKTFGCPGPREGRRRL